ncbi:MAG: DNA-binding transcriptional dual regulator of siderophore biosynthesis and transport [Pseudomonadota bacterium]
MRGPAAGQGIAVAWHDFQVGNKTAAVTASPYDTKRSDHHGIGAPFFMPSPSQLKSIGLKATAPRLKILEIFQRGRQRHMSAEDVYKELLVDKQDIGLATVYRVLMQFEQAGVLKRGNFESGRALFELNGGDHHDHLVCLQCGRVEEFFDPEIETRQSRIARDRGFALQDHALALYGNCVKDDCEHRLAQAQVDRLA